MARRLTSDLTLTDLFCGAGGSSTGAIQVPGVSVRIASNHWDLAVETHNTNHPDADHLCADLSAISPRFFPRTDILWASPECTNHSVAKGRKREGAQPDLFGDVLPDASAERSRATMWDVPRFAEHHLYDAVIVENVVDAFNWVPFRAWLMAMDSLGYDHHVVMLNSMHAHTFGVGAPQSRDRMYVVFWRKGNQRPDFERVTRPNAVCPACGPVRAMQSFKKFDHPWGRYRAQYVYRCPSVKCRNQIVEPTFRPAAEIIDWSLEGQRIGDRAKPLAAKTMGRIQAGIEKYWGPFITEHRHEYRVRDINRPMQTIAASGNHFGLAVPVEGRDGKQAQPIAHPARTMTTRNETGLAFLTQFRDRVRDLDPAVEPLTTVVADGANHGLCSPPDAFIAELRGGGSKHRPVSQPLCTVTAGGGHHGLITPSGGTWREKATSTAEPIPTRTTRETDGVAIGPAVDINDVRFRMLEPREIVGAMDFPEEYVVLGNRREQVRMAGNAVTPPAARDLVGVVAESLGVVA